MSPTWHPPGRRSSSRMIDVTRFHDAVLRRVVVLQREAVCTVELSTVADGVQCIDARGLRSVLIPREQPWGPSDSVLEVNAPAQDEDGTKVVEIKLQSGDLIVVRAEDFAVRSPGVDAPG